MTDVMQPGSMERAQHEHREHEHPSDGRYWAIAGVLAVVTAVEVALSYVHLGNANAPLLLLGMVIKFVLVGGYFMHLKFDTPTLRRIFAAGLVLALGCYLAMLFMFRQFDSGSRQEIHHVDSGVPQVESPQHRP